MLEQRTETTEPVLPSRREGGALKKGGLAALVVCAGLLSYIR